MSPSLDKHLTRMHDKAMQVDALVNALNACIADPNLHSLCVSMIKGLAQISPGLVEGLDTPSRWEE